MLSSVSRRLSQSLGIERMAVLVASRRENGEGGFALAHAAGMAELSDSVRNRLFDLRFFEASLLSGGGKALYVPRGIRSQTAEAAEKAHR